MSGAIPLGSFEGTTEVAVTSTVAEFTNPGPYTSFIVRSDRIVHLARNSDATFDDFQLPEGEFASVRLARAETLSVILADGEADGSLFVTATT